MNKQVLKALCATTLCVASASFDALASGVVMKPTLSSRTSSDAPMKLTSNNVHPPVGTPVCIPAAGRTSNGPAFSNDPGNSVLLLNIGVGNAMTGYSIDAGVEAYAPSQVGNSAILFSSTNPESLNGVIVFFFANMGFTGVQQASTDGVEDLIPLPNVDAGDDGILRIEWIDHDSWGGNVHLNPNAVWSNATSPVVCQGVYVTCTNQGACDAAALAVGGVAGPVVAPRALPITSKVAFGVLIAGLGFMVARKRKALMRGK